MDNSFWLTLDQLTAVCAWRIDRPKGTPHPRYPSFIYPLDYGYLENTRSPNGNGIDIWVGSLAVHNTGPQAAILIERPKEHNA